MNFEILSFILDILILMSLAMTMYLALRLSNSLNNFRAHRKEFNTLMETLSDHINQAQESVINLKAGSRETADELRRLIRQSTELADELELMNKTGNSLAGRLEGIVENRAYAEDNVEEFSSVFEDEIDEDFAITDPEFEDQGLKSQAEQELYEAIQKNKKVGRGR